MTSNDRKELINTLIRLIDDDTVLTQWERRDMLERVCSKLGGWSMEKHIQNSGNNRKLKIKRGTNTENNEYRGVCGEITMDTDEKTIRLHDGETPGGTTLAKQNEIPTNIQIANIAMPSSRYIDLDIGATETEYTAPADGYFVMVRRLNPGGHLAIRNTVTGLGTTAHFYSTSGWINGYVFAPAQAGDTVQITYNNAPSILRFVYANGAQ